MNSKHYIIPVFIPHYGCPHQCVFCNQNSITGRQNRVDGVAVAKEITDNLARVTRLRHIEIAFYGGSFTCLPRQQQQELLAPATQALREGKVHAIRLSTRPDAVSAEDAVFLKAAGVAIVELGVQSLDDEVLAAAGRGHDHRCVAPAVAVLKEAGLQCGIQLMLGLPRQSGVSAIDTARQTAGMHPDFVRLYPALVLAGTPMERLFRQKRYVPLTLPEAVILASHLKLLFMQAHIPVIRTGLQATPELADPEICIAGPYHPSFGEMVDAYLFYQMLCRGLAPFAPSRAPVILHHHPLDHSKIRGLGKENCSRLAQRGYPNLQFVPDGTILNEIRIDYQGWHTKINISMLYGI